jgi:His-Xaa-Ser system radical SAM maturase HxsB
MKENKKIKLGNYNQKKVGFFRFDKIFKNKYLVTNDMGEFVILKEAEFDKLVGGTIAEKNSLYPIFQEMGIIRDNINFSDLISKYRKRNSFLHVGPTLHIVVMTLRCNMKCVYCHASSRGEKEKGYDLSKKNAKKAADIILKAPGKRLAIEFQGGEPLLNWNVLKFFIEYVEKKSPALGKKIEFRLVSNFSILDDAKLKYLCKHNIGICTSLDGPENVHNVNRIWTQGNSYKNVIAWVKKARKLYDKEKKFHPGAILTVTRHSLGYPEEIVDEYIEQGFENIFVRIMNQFGFAKKVWKEVGYSMDEYWKFYQKLLDHVIDYGTKHPKNIFVEKNLLMALLKILSGEDPNYSECRSPCGGGTGQLLYNYDGKVFTCDEGRMIGEDTFCIGDVQKNSYEEIISNSTVKKICVASTLEGLACDQCVFKPYCGVCPIYNYEEFGNIFGQLPSNKRCQYIKNFFGYIFQKMEQPGVRELFEKWVQIEQEKMRSH